ncbi:hypothetical protein HMPREF0083_00926 [Aneurinibacillus aneurinilyticus ATCC 12856]|uniref:Uncharacterized protein n=1 Tax=Aneurinibacillus aneurinilyticus ATCC 12856 TaxID=649747 RepID=U1X8Y8_ANEAE|nr:hypothetical protein HMPREF0083_00926 [Aneurinibacillus aneurinilyticus ATCC 12856]
MQALFEIYFLKFRRPTIFFVTTKYNLSHITQYGQYFFAK